MSGHSKWSTIKRKKETTDQARATVFSKLSRVISIAITDGGGVADPAGNIKLKIAIERARSANMPKSNIDRAIKEAKGKKENLKEVVYEGFGPFGASLIIIVTTDNPNRAISTVKTTLEKSGGKLGSEHSAMYQFTKCAVVEFEKKVNENDVYAFADRAGGIDIESNEDSYYVYIPFEKMGYVSDYLNGLEYKSVDVFYLPKVHISLNSGESDKIDTIVEKLEELPEVDSVYTNHMLVYDK